MTIKTREIAIPKTITKLGGEMPNRPNKESKRYNNIPKT